MRHRVLRSGERRGVSLPWDAEESALTSTRASASPAPALGVLPSLRLTRPCTRSPHSAHGGAEKQGELGPDCCVSRCEDLANSTTVAGKGQTGGPSAPPPRARIKRKAGRVRWGAAWRAVGKACAYPVSGSSKHFLFHCHLSNFKTRCLMRILEGLWQGTWQGHTANVLSNSTANTTTRCRETSRLRSQRHTNTTPFRNTKEDSCRLNGWHPTGTKRV